MNKKCRKITALTLSAALCLSGLGLAFAQPGEPTEQAEPEVKAVAGAADTQLTASKDETVYVLSGADGSVEKIIVSDWIKNAMGSDSLTDSSELENIENVKGNESYRLGGDHTLVWDAQGSDIYYQGDISKELPVELRVSYRLDGQPISAQELAGKSGHVTIRFDYENHQTRLVDIDGRQEEFSVPFTMLTGLLLDNDTFRNVEVSNGKLINDGDRCIVVGLAFPGLQEDLGLSREQLEIPNYVELQADVESFSLGMTVTLATTEPFCGLDSARLDTAEATDALSRLTDAMAQLLDGSSALYDGLCTLLEKSDALVDGVNRLADGALSLRQGAGSLTEGAAQLQEGLTALGSGLDTLSGSNDSLNDGAKQVFDTLLATAAGQLRDAGLTVPELTAENYARVLDELIASLDESAVYERALSQVTAAVEARRPEITEKVTAAAEQQVTEQVRSAVEQQVSAAVTAAVEQQVTDQVLAAMGMTRESYEAALAAGLITPEQQAAVETAVAAQMATEQVQALIAQNTAAQMQTAEVQATITENVSAQMATEEVQSLIARNVEAQVQQAIAQTMASEEVQQQLAATSEGAQSVIALKASLDSYNAFYLGLQSYTSGVDSAADGAARLQQGADSLLQGATRLQDGADSLYDGVLTLRNGLPALTEGITQLRDGAMSLSDGLRQFSQEGIDRLVQLIDEDLDGIAARADATLELARSYRSFTGLSDMDGQVKFLYRTDEICAD